MLSYFLDRLSTKIYLTAWGVSFLAYILVSLIDSSMVTLAIRQGVSWTESILYLLFCMVMLGCGLFWGSLHSYNKSRSRKTFNGSYTYPIDNNKSFSGFKVNKLFVYSLSILLLVAGYLAFKSSGFSGDLQTQREVHSESYGEESGGLRVYLYQYCSAAGIWILAVIPWARNLKLVDKTLPVIIIGLGHFVAALSSASRSQILLQFVLPLVISISLRVKFFSKIGLEIASRNKRIDQRKKIQVKQKNLVRKIISTLLFLFLTIAIISGLVYWQYERSKSLFINDLIVHSRSYIAYYKFLQNYLDFPKEVMLALTFSFKNILEYLSNAWQFFPFFFESYHIFPKFGGYQFHFISSKLQSESWLEWKARVELIYYYHGIDVPNNWGSFVREYVIDYGRFGAPIISLLSGRFVSLCENNFLFNKQWLSLYVVSLTWLLFTPFYSILTIRNIHLFFIFNLTFLSLGKFLKAKSYSGGSFKRT